MSLLDSLDEHTHIVVGGCGTRSMFLIGMLEYLTQHARWENVFAKIQGSAGVSSGSIIALAILVGADFTALSDTLVDLSKRYDSVAPCLDVQMAIDSFGLDDGSVMQMTIDAMLNAIGLSTNATFATLHRLTKKDFRVCAVNMHTMQPVFFSYLSAPHMRLRDAIYMSMTVPFIFKPRRWMGELYVDGGMLANYPTDIFGSDVVPLVLYMPWETKTPPTSLRSFASAVASSSLYVQLQQLQQWKAVHPRSVCGSTTGMGSRSVFCRPTPTS